MGKLSKFSCAKSLEKSTKKTDKEGYEPVVFFLAGGGGSGKSSATGEILAQVKPGN